MSHDPFIHDCDECSGCARCYQRLGDSRCAVNCLHGLQERWGELRADLLGAVEVSPDTVQEIGSLLTRFSAIATAADVYRNAVNEARMWVGAADAAMRDAKAAAVQPAYRALCRAMDGE